MLLMRTTATHMPEHERWLKAGFEASESSARFRLGVAAKRRCRCLAMQRASNSPCRNAAVLGAARRPLESLTWNIARW